MNSMKQEKQTEAFETMLLSYVDMCYAVALALTHNPNDARNLTREVLEWAWNLLDRGDADKYIKTKLLVMMRRKFIEGYQSARKSRVKNIRIAERV
jgi:DNA-directed RNA polymerase specialized sigma24 family protein